MLNRVYCNRTLNMKRINYIGLDMDHTLIRYKTENFEKLTYEVLKTKLIKNKNYPASIGALKFTYNRSIRGLVVDKTKGNLLKLSRHTAIRQSSHGTQPISFQQQNKIYKSTYIDIKDNNFDKLDTAFSIAFAVLYAQLIDLKESTEKDTLPDYATIASDLNGVLDQAHRDDSLKGEVKKNISHYIIKDRELVRGILKFIKHGKKFFIVTNSDYNYLEPLLNYAINPFLKKGQTWRDIFHFVIVSARKPVYFYEKQPLLVFDSATRSFKNFEGPMTPGIYSGGCADQFTTDLNLNPDEILYIGDHIYGDVVRLKKDCAWRTALVVEELDEEVSAIIKAQPIMKKINALMAQKIPLETQIDVLISKKIESANPEKKNPTIEKKIEALIKKSKALDKKISPLIQKQQSLFNPYWGEVMRVGNEESYFAYLVERFACIYMARLSNLLSDNPRTYFRSFRRDFPHELIKK
jgi:HAD superfamily 5'-nucleotidase-like hydrolase